MGEQELIFDVDDFVTISLECPTCHNILSFRLESPAAHGLPKGCSICLDGADMFARVINAYLDFRRIAAHAKLRVQLRAKPVPVVIQATSPAKSP